MRRTDALIRDLARDLSPVQPIPELRRSIGWIVVSALTAGVFHGR